MTTSVPRSLAAVQLFERGVRLADAGGDAQVDAMPPARARARLAADAVEHLLGADERPAGAASARVRHRESQRPSSARFSFSTLTRGSPRTTSVRPSVYWLTMART